MEGQRARWPMLAIGALVALVAVVAVAAAVHAPGGGSSRPSTPAPTLVRDYLATLALLVVPIGMVLFVWAALLRRVYAKVPVKKPDMFPFQIAPRPFAWVALFFVLLAILVVRAGRDSNPAQAPPAAVTGGEEKKSEKSVARDRYEPQFRWLPMIVVGTLVLGVGGALLVMNTRRRHELLLAARPVHETLAEVLDETLDDLRRERDPRKAVIGAYAKMERMLAARGLPRRKSEAPREYLERILGAVSASEHSVRKLSSLFARARFSRHEIDAGMKKEAIDALMGLRAELAVAR